MKKLLFLFAVLLTSVGAWAQTSYTVSATTGTGVSGNGYSKTWTYTVSDANPAALTLTAAASNMKVIDGQLTLWTGTASPYTYTLQVPVFYRIVSYSFDFVRQGTYAANESVTLTVGEQTYTATTETQKVTVNNVNAGSTSFKMTGSNKGIVVTDFVVVVDCAFEVTTDETKPIWHTIKNVRGNVYAQYNGSGKNMQLSPVADTKGHLFYFTAGSNGGYKIHNAATTNKCADFTSWNTDGIDWYITPSGNTDKPGWAITKNADRTGGWNNAGNSGTSVAGFSGDDIGSTWAIERFTSDISSVGIKMSTNDTKYLYNIKNDRKSKFANYTGNGKFSQTGATNPGSYWYFVEVPDVEGVPEGYKACYIYNAATDLAVQNHSNGFMSTPTDGTYPAKIYFVGPYEATYWGYVIYPKGSNTGWNDLDGSSVTDYNYKTDGSIWDIIPADKTEATLKTEAATAKTNALNKIALYEYADYYTYADDAIVTAKTTVNAATNDNLKNALFGHVAINNAIATLEASAKGTTAPAAGDIIQLKHRSDNKYLKDNGTNANNTDNQNDLATLWYVEEGDGGNVKLKNVSTNKYIGQIRKSAAVEMQADVADAAQFAWTNQTGTYAVFKDVNTESVVEGDLNYLYGHVNGDHNLVGWEPNDDNTQWLVSKVNSFTIVYKHNDVVQSTVTEYVKQGAVYTVSSPIAFTAPSAVTVGEAELEAADGVFSFEPTGGETVTVELVESLPFTKTKLNDDGSFPLNTVWYVILQNSTANSAEAWKYDAVNGVTTEAISGITAYTDNHLWCFAGSKDDLKIYNKVAGSSLSLTNTDPASMVAEHEAVWKMVKSADEATFSGKGPFCLQKGNETSYLNLKNGKLKYYSQRDKGSTIRVAAYLSVKYMFKGVELTEHSVNQLVDLGSTHTITNPYANKYVNVTCAVNGNRVEAVDGQWTVNVSQPTSVIVTITEDLPFKTSTDYATANWHYLQMNSNNWKYMQTKVADNKTESVNVNSLGDRALWAFVGDAINGFKIWNKGAGEGYVLTVDAVTNQTEAYMKENGTQVWTIEKGNGGFIIRQGTQECLNDFAGGSVMKIWNNSGAPTGTGSAFRTISGGVTDLADLCLPGIFTLQAERSPLLYDANAGEPTKLSSGMVSNIPANAKDSRQQFMISESDTDGLYYLYNIAAARFVDANLNFTDYPEPVLSFEANPANPVFPWFVKIGGKYVVPGSNGEVNKIFHTSTPSEDDGKRYRIEYVDEDLSLAQAVDMVIQHADGLLKDASSLSNSKVYLVSTYDRGAWMYNDEKDALWSTRVADPNSADPNNPNWLPGSANSEDEAQQFAFLTVGGKTYLYSVGAGKFVVKSGDYTAYSDNPTQPVVLLPAAGNKFFPIVVAFVDGENQHHIGISNGFTPPVITNYNNLEDSGNKVDIREVGDLENSAEILAKMETYLTAQTLVPELQALIEKAEAALTYLLESDNKVALATAKTTAENLLTSGSYTAETLGVQITALTTALNNATLVSETTGFNNAYVYTFVSKRGWMVATEEDATVKSTNEGDADEALHQWAVYKSENNNYYLYNIGKQQFMGFVNTGGAKIPFAETPQMTTLTFKKSNWADYPIMFSVDNVGAVNNDMYGDMKYWNNGWTNLQDDGNNHKVTIVGAVPSASLTDIENAVVLFEAVDALEAALADADNRLDNALGYYSCTAEAQTELDAIEEFLATATDAAAIDEKTARVNELIATFTLNKPQAGKFYRLKGISGNYIDATSIYNNANATSGQMSMKAEANANLAGTIFYLDDLDEENHFLNYATGTYVRQTSEIGAVGATKGVWSFDASTRTLGKLVLSCTTISSNAGQNLHDNEGTRADRCSSVCGERHDWTVEEVTSLPFTFNSKALGFATFCAPVNVVIPNDVTAYIAEIQGKTLKMRKFVVEDGENLILPAETPVMLYKDDYLTEATIELQIVGGEYTLSDEDKAKNNFFGTIAAEELPTDETYNYYSLQKKASDSKVGFYRKAEGDDKVLGGFKAWIMIEEAEYSQARAFTIIFDGDNATGIKEALGLENENVEIYDLSGRRLDKPAKGVNIIGGKLVVK